MPQVLFLTFFPDVASALGTVAESGGSWADDVANAMELSVEDLWRESQGAESSAGPELTDSQILAGVPNMRSPAPMD